MKHDPVARPAPGLAPLLALLALAAGCHRPPADSTAPGFATAKDRVAWMKGRLRVRPPSPMRDAQFQELEDKIPSGHMGPGYSMWWLQARIEIDPNDADAWAATTKGASAPPGWRRDANPLLRPAMPWAMAPEEFDGARWFDPGPLFDPGAHGGYKAGHLAINRAGTAVFVWQHWR
jgi:hypothetical protein